MPKRIPGLKIENLDKYLSINKCQKNIAQHANSINKSIINLLVDKSFDKHNKIMIKNFLPYKK